MSTVYSFKKEFTVQQKRAIGNFECSMKPAIEKAQDMPEM